MKNLLNTLFITTEDAYAALDGENVVIKIKEETIGRFPLHILENIYSFSYAGASPALMGKCVKRNINLSFFSPRGRFLARVVGASTGNVLLRRTQYRAADDPVRSIRFSRNMIVGKLFNCRQVLQRAKRDHPQRIDVEKFSKGICQIKTLTAEAEKTLTEEGLRGIEGSAAAIYFGLFDDMILQNKDDFFFRERSRRPPLDHMNALLSFIYTITACECASALEGVGLDSYVGFFHADRPGRASLSLDLMEELRPCFCDRFALTLVNERILNAKDFHKQENGAVLLSESGRKKVQKEWQEKKKTKITHPFLGEKIEWGIIPHVQALLLARALRRDIDGYPPFLWR